MGKDDVYWVTLELSYQGEKERPDVLEKALHRVLYPKEVEIFVPSVSFQRRDKHMIVCAMEGYVFVKAGLPASLYFEFEKSPLILRVLTSKSHDGRFMSYVPDSTLDVLRESLKEQITTNFKTGDRVTIMEGAYANLSGEIHGLSPDETHAYIKVHDLLSINTYVSLPVQFLEGC